ncbi:hypothetical protein PF005_g7856 [Phytophthora fragariae]|uniref:DDE Tnp4 domain-containing protein n=1 Tax=Phytophthora fragariae TaxID=53985 RepID=A0A6A3QEA2_9STRA|nr:hypothetical protein PF009_g7208 [Phytophthora fragariae]KAE8986491.1 hypothetical protein PF011_g19964 [Phytophthora fragariae]KAE9074361.1 hypothetical protein PF007_g25441 [Phytophthora fragariae]KAE9121466.1 hypothetical protein PF010_g7098 [Phytophthora fragariae]KAE9148312.1 hypothetical protein PF006_g7071 [Phytophthora fragariae]
MDGTLIALKRPCDYEGWYNRKGYPSVNVQAVCDHRKRFISFDIRPGSWSDAKIFKHSSFGLNIARLLPQGHHVLAHSGYGILPLVMTPYNELDEGGALSVKQARFNFNLSSTRMVIEGAFGLLKERFRILKKALEERSPTASKPQVLTTQKLFRLYDTTRNYEPRWGCKSAMKLLHYLYKS